MVERNTGFVLDELGGSWRKDKNAAGLIFGVHCFESCKMLVLSWLLDMNQTTTVS